VPAHLKNHPDDHLGPCCQTDSQCGDANPCTMDTCTSAGACVHTPVTCASGDACNDDMCIPEEGGCVAVPKPAGTTCNDDKVCTGANETDVCNAEGKCGGTAIAGCCLTDADCNDSNACTADVCNTTTNTCSNTETPPTAAACHVYVCDQEIGWIDTDVTCIDDGNICTVEACDPTQGTTGACVTTVNQDPPEGTQEVSCNDGLDNDCDGLIDSADADCAPPVTCPCDSNPMWSVAYFQAAIDADENVACRKYGTGDMSMWEMLYQRSIDVWSGKCWSGPSSIPLTPEQIPVCEQRIAEIASQLNPPVTCVGYGGGGGAF